MNFSLSIPGYDMSKLILASWMKGVPQFAEGSEVGDLELEVKLLYPGPVRAVCLADNPLVVGSLLQKQKPMALKLCCGRGVPRQCGHSSDF